MKLVNLLGVLTFLLVASCATEDEKMQRYLVGNWETVYGKVEMPSYKNTDAFEEYTIDFANPYDKEAIRQGKPCYEYKADGTFKKWTELYNRPTGQQEVGKWRATKDSLFWDFDKGPGRKIETVSFGIKKIEDGFAIAWMNDTDNDGKGDDTVYLETVRLPDTRK